MNYMNCEKAGISAKNIKSYLEYLEKNQLSTHDVIIARGDNIIFEKYYAPFDESFLHRMYSVSKSFVSLAIGFLWQDGKISLDDKIVDYFKEESKDIEDENVKNQTIKHMLMMSTAKPCENWFVKRCEDRVKAYFENSISYSRPSGTIYDYDSSGSFVLGALVERLTNKPFMEYLREKLFRKIGVSEEAYCLKCPGGHSWGDSAILCTPMDLLKTARFVLNGGSWKGEQILSADYIKEATKKQIDNDSRGIIDYNTLGYGYQFWMTYQNSFFFNGMGDQIAVCIPHKDIIFIYNGDNQGKDGSRKKIIDGFYDIIVNNAEDKEIPYDEEAHNALSKYADSLELRVTDAKPYGKAEEKINNVVYDMSPNPMGITKMQFSFDEDELKLNYTNAQGDKTIYAGRVKNAFSKFPQEGYSDEIGSQAAPGNFYDCAASFGWVSDSELFIKVQIIDKYFGTLEIKAGFLEDKLGICMTKMAEDFLDEYEGFAGGAAKS